jgi:hypothetical protein
LVSLAIRRREPGLLLKGQVAGIDAAQSLKK